jgi:hypothetical protein
VKKGFKILVSGSCTMVKLMTLNPMFKGSNLVTVSPRIKEIVKKGFTMPVSGSRVMVKLMTHDAKFKGFNPVSASTNIEKTVKVL